MAKRKPVIDIEDCTRLIEKRRYRDAVYAFEEILDKLTEAKKSPRGSQVAKELKKLVTAIEDSFEIILRGRFGTGPAAQAACLLVLREKPGRSTQTDRRAYCLHL
jgi:hypothetical protein